MNINNLTIKSQEALQQAQQIAQSFGQQQLENEHIFKGILEVDQNVTPFILKKLNVNVDLFKKILDSTPTLPFTAELISWPKRPLMHMREPEQLSPSF